MMLPRIVEELSEIRAGLTADPQGQLRAASDASTAERDALATAAAADGLASAGVAAGLTRLEVVLVKGASGTVVVAIRPDEILRVVVDPAKGSGQVERALHAWALRGDAPSADDPPPEGIPAAAAAPPPPRPPAPAPAAPAPVAAEPSGRAGPAPDVAPDDAWAALRRALVRGQLTEAATHRRDLVRHAGGTPRPGAEPVTASEVDVALQLLVQGIGSVLAGDGVGGARTLEALASAPQRNLSSPGADAPQRNLSFRWVALFWSGRGAVRSGNSAAARAHVSQALALAKDLDLAAVAAARWLAGEVLVHDGDHDRALAYLTHARSGFDRLGDAWGLGQTWLAAARVYAALDRDPEATAAARQARRADPAWEEPAVFLARRALARGDFTDAAELLRSITGPAAERVRSLIAAMREGAVGPEDAGEFLRLSDAPLTSRSIRAMERIAKAAPGFAQAREALAWMLLKVGMYADAGTIFRGLLGQRLTEADRASVMLGLGCIAHALERVNDPEARLQAAVSAGGAAPPGKGGATPGGALPNLPAAALPARSALLASSGAVFSGQLSVFALPDVVEFVRSARRTGLLVCSSRSGMAAVHFRDGRITGASSPAAPGVGELLVGARKLSTGALRAAGNGQGAGLPDRALGSALVREGLVDAAAVEEALRRQVELTLLELVQWKEGEFAFSREGEPEDAGADVAVELDAQDVLLTVFKELDETRRGGSAPGARS